jgi:hypothetical protein
MGVDSGTIESLQLAAPVGEDSGPTEVTDDSGGCGLRSTHDPAGELQSRRGGIETDERAWGATGTGRGQPLLHTIELLLEPSTLPFLVGKVVLCPDTLSPLGDGIVLRLLALLPLCGKVLLRLLTFLLLSSKLLIKLFLDLLRQLIQFIGLVELLLLLIKGFLELFYLIAVVVALAAKLLSLISRRSLRCLEVFLELTELLLIELGLK